MRMATLICLLLPANSLAQAVTPVEKDVRVFGQKIHYVEAGSSGPVVILLHGLGASSAHWRLTIPALQGLHVYAPDQLGFGKSDKPDLNYRISTLVDALSEFYAQTGITRATIVGSSMGGWVATAFATAYPDKVEKLVLVDSTGYSQQRWNGPPVGRAEMLRLNPATLADMRALLLSLFANKALVTDVAVKAAFEQKLAAGDGHVINAFVESVVRNEDYVDGKLGALTMPTLLIWGKQDALVPLAVANAFNADIKGSRLTVLDQCGHVPQLECFMPFNAALTGFLNGK